MGNPTKTARLTVSAVSAIYAIVLYATGIRLQHDARQLLAYLPSAFGLLIILFDSWAWKWPVIHNLTGRPRIDGTWIASLRPHPDSHIPSGGNRGPIQAAVMIDQTYWSLGITLMTRESASHSTAASLRRNGDSRDRQILTYTYANEPMQEHRPRSQPYVGATQLRVGGRRPTQIAGTYWTDRLTVGDVDLSLLNRNTDYPTLEAALEAKARAAQLETTSPS
jgi:SMODS-associating 2TM, beta-strand rich effector domain